MPADLHGFAKKLAAAKCPEDVFGVLETRSPDLKRRDLAGAYRRLVLVVHPDRYSGPDVALANSCFTQLGILREQAERKIAAGTYGDLRPIQPPPPPRPAFEEQIVKTPKTEYVVQRLLAEGDLADVYLASAGKGRRARAYAFKLAMHPGDNDLLEHEAKILGAIEAERVRRQDRGSPKRGYQFIPRIADTFVLRGSSRTNRRVNVIEYADGYVSLAQISAAYPTGLDFRDVVWIFKRMLYALWFVHTELKIVHGAIVPPHVLVHPTEHGAKLVDWCYAVTDWPKRATHVRAISKTHRAYYPPEIFAKAPPSPATDIYMAAKCVLTLLGGNHETNVIPTAVPTPIRAFLQGCMLASPAKRPNDAGALHEEFDDLLLRVVGKPTYRPLAMPEK